MSISAISATPASSAAALDAVAGAETSVARKGGAVQNSAADIKKACGQFEAIILRQLLAPSIEPMMNGGLGGGSGAGGGGGGVYGYMLTDVLASSLSQGGGIGLSNVLARQLSPRGTSVDALDATSADPESAATDATPLLLSSKAL